MAATNSGEVVIVGGGIIGCLTAYFLSVRGVRPVVVEADAIASGASGTSGGWLTPYSHDCDPAMIALSPLVLLTEVRRLRLVESEFLPALLLAAVATLAYESTILLTLVVRTRHVDWLASLLDVLVPAAIASVLLLIPVYGLVRLASRDIRRQAPL